MIIPCSKGKNQSEQVLAEITREQPASSVHPGFMRKIFFTFLLYFCYFQLLAGSGWAGSQNMDPLYKADHVFNPGQYCTNVHSPTITVLPDESLLTAFWCARTEGSLDGRIVSSKLEKGSDSWSRPETIADTPERFDGNPVLYTYPDGRIWLLFSVRDPDAPGMVQIVTRISKDGGESWSSPQPFMTPRGVRTRNHPVSTGNGDILLPLHDHRSGDSLFYTSPDLGESWIAGGRIVCAGECIQPSVISRADGSLYTLMRTWSKDPAKRFLLQSESQDFGRTWSTPTHSRIRSVNSAVEAITLMSGKVALVFNDGTSRKRTPLNIALSEDGGRSWVFNRVLESGKGPYSYPSIVQSSDSVLHVVYTYERRTIRHVRFNEAWIMSGE